MEKTQKGIVTIIAILFALIIVGVVFSALHDDSQPEQNQAATAVAQQDSEDDRDYMREGYMQGCVEGESEWQGYCDCSYDYIVDNYGKQGMIYLAGEYEKGNEPELMEEAAMQCYDEIPY